MIIEKCHRTAVVAKIYIHVYMCVCILVCMSHVCGTMCENTWGSQKRMSDSLELKLQEVVSHLKWMLGVKLKSSGRAVSTLNK